MHFIKCLVTSVTRSPSPSTSPSRFLCLRTQQTAGRFVITADVWWSPFFYFTSVTVFLCWHFRLIWFGRLIIAALWTVHHSVRTASQQTCSFLFPHKFPSFFFCCCLSFLASDLYFTLKSKLSIFAMLYLSLVRLKDETGGPGYKIKPVCSSRAVMLSVKLETGRTRQGISNKYWFTYRKRSISSKRMRGASSAHRMSPMLLIPADASRLS